ncbi:DUF2807 domain-containing protein [Glaciihabitans arcticus]|uniref:DUF2807 domain-containing protein n=1 Tax=Glaciihabitans arcticus TaxID=2668039 RepID=A0A4Q9GTB3_9MICO|nr:head GIN domain-containing protein [Glaciihabitans arcticus]TBN58252.1 DUF2807 domain-containing protein [Glaciihabitans arcticus]
MKRFAALLVTLVTLTALSGCAILTPPGKQVTESREIGDVTAVELSSGGSLVVSVGSTPSLEITAGENMIGRLSSDVSGGTLDLGIMPGIGFVTGNVSYALTVTSLDTLEIKGSGDAEIDFAGAEEVDLDIDGSGSISGTNLDAREVDIEIAGSGDVELEGEASSFSLTISGSGEYLGDDLTTEVADVTISGSGEVELSASDSLDVTINGSGEVRYTGGATLEQNINGSGEITEY